MKKLIYILNHYSDDQGSHFYHILNLLEEIASNGVEIVLIIEKGESKPIFENNAIKVIIQKETKSFKRMIELFTILKKLNKEGFRKIFIRISQNAALPAIAVCKLYGSQVYYWQSGTTHIEDNKKPLDKEKIIWYLKSKIPFELVKNNVNYFVTGPESMLPYYEKIVGVKKDKLLCLYNDIDITRFSTVSESEKIKIKKELGINKDKKIILFVKRMSKIKGILFYSPYIIKENAELLREQNYVCYYLGDGSEKEKLMKAVEKEGLTDIIKIIGNKPNKDIQRFYQIADIFINPTLEEGFPRVLIEAMASGLPTITTNAGGTVDIVGDIQSEYMVDIKDREGFSEKLMFLVKNEEVQGKLSIENRNEANKFSTENVAKMYIERIFADG